MNKRGMFFTFIAILLIIVLLVAFVSKIGIQQTEESSKSNAKLAGLNSFVKSFDAIAGRALQASSKHVILSSLNYTAQGSRQYIPSYPIEFKSIIYNGKLVSNTIIPNADKLTISKTLEIVEKVAQDNNIILIYDKPIQPQDISITQISPWEMEVSLTLKNAIVTDNKDPLKSEVTWNLGEAKVIKTKLYVTDYSDPFTLKELGEDLPIKKYANPQNYQLGQQDYLNDLISSEQFIAHGDGPNFLQRMSGDFKNDVNGIERVLPDSLGADPTPTLSNVDFYYWGAFGDQLVSCNVEGYGANFKLDSKHKIYYSTTPCA